MGKAVVMALVLLGIMVVAMASAQTVKFIPIESKIRLGEPMETIKLDKPMESSKEETEHIMKINLSNKTEPIKIERYKPSLVVESVPEVETPYIPSKRCTLVCNECRLTCYPVHPTPPCNATIPREWFPDYPKRAYKSTGEEYYKKIIEELEHANVGLMLKKIKNYSYRVK